MDQEQGGVDLLGLAAPGIGGGCGGDVLGEGGGQGGGGVGGGLSGDGELAVRLEVVVLDGLVAGLQAGCSPAVLHLCNKQQRNTVSYTTHTVSYVTLHPHNKHRQLHNTVTIHLHNKHRQLHNIVTIHLHKKHSATQHTVSYVTLHLHNTVILHLHN